MNNRSAEIVDMDDARARRHAGDAADDYVHAGAQLAAAREASGLDLSGAAARTHIKQIHLEAIEALNVGALPARPYAIGFVKTYAEFLGLEASAIVTRFKEEAGYAAPTPVSVEKFEAAQQAAEEEYKDLSLFAVFAVIAFILWCAWQITRPHEVRLINEPAAPSAPLAASDGVGVDLERNVIETRILEQVAPVFPYRCLARAGARETVTVRFNITAQGRVSGERIVAASNPCLEEAALNAIARWRFEPVRADGAARAVYDQKYTFSFAKPR